VCARAPNATKDDEGFIQVNKQTGKKFVIGRLNDVDIENASKKNYLSYIVCS
jgi:hypothetical protein